MEYLRSGLKSVLGAPETNTELTGAETIDRLVNRVTSSTLLDDRRDACRAIRALSRKHRLQVGAHAMDAIKQVLELDRNDSEIIGYCLDTLCNITSKELFEEETQDDTTNSVTNRRQNIGEQFTEMFIKHTENVTLVLSFLEEYEFKVRWPAVRLITSLLSNRTKEIQDIILVSPMGVSKLMDLLQESREVIRNDALLLLIQLTKNNANIQKIVAFENAFDRLFDVIRDEDYTDGGIVVEDCLLLMLNLLRNNVSNINFFKEGTYIQKMSPMFTLPTNIESVGWSAQKVANMHCLLQLLRCLVGPHNPSQSVASCQKAIRHAGLLEALCNMLMASGVPANLLTETINALAEAIRGDVTSQEYFASVMAPSQPPRSSLVVLLMSMVNNRQQFALRCSVLYCFECFLYRNDVGQTQVVQTLLPKTVSSTVPSDSTSAQQLASSGDTLTTGQILCGGLFGTDSLSSWFSSIGLSHCLIENPIQKEQLLRVMLATSASVRTSEITSQSHLVGSGEINGLLQQCAVSLQQTNVHKQAAIGSSGNGLAGSAGGSLTSILYQPQVQHRLGVLQLFATWFIECPSAVRSFLRCSGAVAFLTAQASSVAERNDDEGNEDLMQGVCAYLMGLCLLYNDNSVPEYDRQQLLQLIERRVTLETFSRRLTDVGRHTLYAQAAKRPQPAANQPAALLLDYEFCRLFRATEAKILEAVKKSTTTINREGGGIFGGEVLVPNSVGPNTSNGIASSESVKEFSEINGDPGMLLSKYKALIREQDERQELLKTQLTETCSERDHLLERLRELEVANAQLHDENTIYKAKIIGSTDNITPLVTKETYSNSFRNEGTSVVLNLDGVNILNDNRYIQLEESLDHMKKTITQLEVDNSEKASELDRMQRDQDDLLELLTDQDQKLNTFKRRLRELGETVADEEQSKNEENVDNREIVIEENQTESESRIKTSADFNVNSNNYAHEMDNRIRVSREFAFNYASDNSGIV